MSEESEFAGSPELPGAEGVSSDVGQLFPGYEILQLIGQGGMGTVYQARQIALERLVAIKLLPSEISSNEDFAASFRREAQAMARLNHPNIVAVHDFGQTADGRLYCVMEYVEGSNLFEIIRKVGLDVEQTLSVVDQMCAALGYAHGKGVVHRDIKPGNVLVDTESNVKVTDFGLARLMDSSVENAAARTTDLVFGTPDYMAPEQRSDMDVDHRADIYSLGIMTYEMLCGEVPRGAFQLPSQRIGCDQRIDQIVLKAMQQSPELRYQSVDEIEADIAAARTPLAPTRPVAAVPRPSVVAGPALPSPTFRAPVAQPSVRAAGPLLPRPRVSVPTPVQPGGGPVVGWVVMGASLLIGAVLLLYYAPWKGTPSKTVSAPEPAPTEASAPVRTPTPAPVPTRTQDASVASIPASGTEVTMPPVAGTTVPAPDRPPSTDVPAAPASQAQEEVKKWLADTDARQQEAFQQGVTKIYEAGVAGLRARYLAALDAGLAKASAAGQLDHALVWRTERQSFAGNEPMLTDEAISLPELRAMRADYRQKLARLEQERAARAKQLHAGYDAILVKYSTLLTQRQRLDDALLLQTKRNEIAEAWGIETQPAPAQPASTPDKPPGSIPGTDTHSSISLLTLTPVRKPVVGYGELVTGGSDYFGDPILVDGEACTEWLGAHAESKVAYSIPSGTKSFKAVGVWPGRHSFGGGSWRYIVKIDGNQVFKSKPLNEYPKNQVPIEVSVPAFSKIIELAVDDMGSFRMDHSVWAQPVFKK